MLHLYSDKECIPKGVKYIRDNVRYFIDVTINKLDSRVDKLLPLTDCAVYLNKDYFTDKYGCSVPWIDLSTGGMTLLNIFYNDDCCFDTLECGRNALTDLKNFSVGRAYPDHIWNLDKKDEIDVIVDDNPDYRYTSFERWEHD